MTFDRTTPLQNTDRPAHLYVGKGGRMHLHHIGLASPVMAMDAFVEKFRAWIETVVGCASAETMTLQCKFPFSHLVLEQLLADVNLDRQCLNAAESLRPLVRQWEIPPDCSPRIEVVASRDRRALLDNIATYHGARAPDTAAAMGSVANRVSNEGVWLNWSPRIRRSSIREQRRSRPLPYWFSLIPATGPSLACARK